MQSMAGMAGRMDLQGCSRLHHPGVPVLLSVGNDLGHIGHQVTVCGLQRLHLHRLVFLRGCTLGVDLDGELLASGYALAPVVAGRHGVDGHAGCKHACGGRAHP